MQGQGVVARARCRAVLHRATTHGRSTRTRLARSGYPWPGATGEWGAAGARGGLVTGAARARKREGDDHGEHAPRPPDVAVVEVPTARAKKGSVAGAAALVIGTSIGSGILAVPQRTAAAGFIPSAACMVTCWLFLVVEALLLSEINVHLRRENGKDVDVEDGSNGQQLEVISVKSMAEQTLGGWGGNLAAVTYLFLSYTSMVAYTSKSGEVLARVFGVAQPVSGGAFTAALALLVAGGGTGVTDRVNQLLTFVMIGLLLTIEVSAVAFGGGLTLPANTNWEQVPAALPVIIFTLVYHDIAPVICAYLGGDLTRIRVSILVGSLVPLLSLLVWDDIALTLSKDLDGFDILDMVKTDWSYTVVEAFSLLAVGTSLIGTLLGSSQFFIEQMTNFLGSSGQRHVQINDDSVGSQGDGSRHFGAKTALQSSRRIGYVSTGLVVAPTVLIAATVPNSFSIATDIAGGYCMTILYGVLPPLMAWAIISKLPHPKAGLVEAEPSADDTSKPDFTSARPVLVGMGMFSVLMVFEQILQDFVSFKSYLLSWTS